MATRSALAPWAEQVPGATYPMTVDDLMALPRDGWRYELVEGRLVRMAPVGLEHGDIVWNLGDALRHFVRTRNLGVVTPPETGFIVGRSEEGDVVLAPDLAYIPAARVPPPGSPERRRYVASPPDLVVEIASPSQFEPEMAAKTQMWLQSGVRLVWVIWPARQRVDVWQPGRAGRVASLRPGDMLDGSEALPGFMFPVAGVFTG